MSEAPEAEPFLADEEVEKIAPLNGVAPFRPGATIVTGHQRSCAACGFSMKEGLDRVCRFNPPQVTMIGVPVVRPPAVRGQPPQQGLELKSFTQFPIMQDSQWCGQFVARNARYDRP
jgi:hypothetical protein